MGDLNTNARTLADLMFDRAAEHIAQNTRVPSRSEKIEINRARLQKGRAELDCQFQTGAIEAIRRAGIGTALSGGDVRSAPVGTP